MKQVIQLDRDGYFEGTTVADESPLEPGVYLYPARAVDAPMPEPGEGERAYWNGEKWEYHPLRDDMPAQPHPSWSYDLASNSWVPPVPRPDDEHVWDESEEDWVPSAELRAKKARAQRNALLSDCDWTQLSDAPVDAEDWAMYRQALRDLPEQPGFPTDIEWPVRPEE